MINPWQATPSGSGAVDAAPLRRSRHLHLRCTPVHVQVQVYGAAPTRPAEIVQGLATAQTGFDTPQTATQPTATRPTNRAFLIFSGSNTRAVVAFCRVLASRRLPIHIVARTAEDPILRTRYRRHVAATRAFDRLDLDDLDRCIAEARRQTGVEEFVISPTSEFLNLFLLEQREFLASRGCTVPLVDHDLYRQVSDKHSFSRICQSQGIAIPQAITIETLPEVSTPAHVPECSAGAGVRRSAYSTNETTAQRLLEASPKFPFVAKPLYNISADKRSLYPHLIFGAEELAAFRRSENAADFYFEEFVVGPSFYLLYYLSRRGQVTAWSQQNLAQQPGGKSIVLARSAQLHHDPLAARFVDLLQGLGFWGLAMIEVIRREDEYVFIELNPRFWGPFQLLLNAGSPLIDAFIDDQLDLAPRVYPAPPHPQATYLWLGGMAEAWAAGKPLRWHEGAPRHWARFIARHWRSDVYARPDTAGLFLDELKAAARRRNSNAP